MEIRLWYRLRYDEVMPNGALMGKDYFLTVREDRLSAEVAALRKRGTTVTKIVLVGFQQVEEQG